MSNSAMFRMSDIRRSTLCLFGTGRTLEGVSKCWPAQELLFKREMRDSGDGTVSKGLGVHIKSQGQW